MRVVPNQNTVATDRPADGRLGVPRSVSSGPSPNGAEQSGPRERVRVERGAKRVRAYLAGAVVVDSIEPLLVWEIPYYPTYYFHEDDVQAELVADGGADLRSPSRGDAKTLTVL